MRKTEEARKIFEARGYYLTDDKLKEFDWRDMDQLETAVQFSSLDKIRRFLLYEDMSDLMGGI